MSNIFWEYRQKKNKEYEAKGEKYTQDLMAEEFGISAAYLSRVINGKGTLKYKDADKIELLTNGELKADDLLECSLELHRKYLERKKRFGEGK